mmetsp:Transcript_25927/g.36141  ORF Transcript_25927/g.36141 Transcript_25927/m.36141 type:complete len:97 (-) Transcript_25927:227-517(-)
MRTLKKQKRVKKLKRVNKQKRAKEQQKKAKKQKSPELRPPELRPRKIVKHGMFRTKMLSSFVTGGCRTPWSLMLRSNACLTPFMNLIPFLLSSIIV